MQPNPTSHPRSIDPRSRLRRLGERGLFWVKRYAAQDLASKAAVLGFASAFQTAELDRAGLATTSALVEVLAFYVIAWVRRRRAPGGDATSRAASLVALLREYGPAELVDLAARPAAMTLGLASVGSPSAGLMLGSLLADLAFYAAAIASCRLGGLVAEVGASADRSELREPAEPAAAA
ncbi:MAG: hypothetical protein HZA52_21075 [Planctomycetes bacterium]|nr:hypothetical protein [Planctomycetota bacterium]